MTTAATAYTAARTAFAAELADLQRQATAQMAVDPATVDWAAVGSVQAAVATLHDLTDRANGRGESASADFRITVTTSTLWGIVGVGIIAVALLVLLGAVARFGRR